MTETNQQEGSGLLSGPEWSRESRNANVAALMTFAAFLGLGFVLPFLPLFVQELGVKDPVDAAQWAGVLIGVGPLLAGLLAPFWGGLADRYGYKPVALLALTALGLSQIVASVAQSPVDVLVSRLLSGLFGGVGPLGLAMASGQVQKGRGSSSGSSGFIGRIQAAQILAAGFGPLLGGALASFLGIRAAFWAASISCLFAAGVVGVLYEERRPQPHDRPKSSIRGTETSLKGFLMALGAVVFFVNFASRSFTPILPAQLAAFGVAPTALALSTGILISVYSVAAAVSSFGFGRLAAKIEPARLLGFSLFLSLLAAVAMAQVSTFKAFLAVAMVFGLVSGGSLTLGYSIGSRRFSDAARGASFGRLSGLALVGGAVAPAIAAFVGRFSLQDVYWMNALVYAGLISIALLFLRETKPRTTGTGH